MKYEELLKIFEIGDGCDETYFYFKTDPKEIEHYIGDQLSIELSFFTLRRYYETKLSKRF